MVKATELRIGNLVNIDTGEDPVFQQKVLSVESDGINTVYDKLGWRSHFIEAEMHGIPLSEEWLLTFGFEKKKHQEENYFVLFPYNTGKLMAFIAPHDNQMRVNLRVYNVEASCPLHYVHQLQNLYFALTGEELTLKP